MYRNVTRKPPGAELFRVDPRCDRSEFARLRSRAAQRRLRSCTMKPSDRTDVSMKEFGSVAPSSPSSTDRELVARFLAGDELVIELFRSWVRSQLRPLAGRSVNAEDIEQEVLLDLLEALEEGRFRGESQLETYVRTFSRFKCIDRLRTRGRRSFVAIEDVDLRDAEPSPFERVARAQDHEMAHRVLERLPANCRELWSMVHAGLSYTEISCRLSISEGTLRVRVYRCRRRALALRDQLLAERDL